MPHVCSPIKFLAKRTSKTLSHLTQAYLVVNADAGTNTHQHRVNDDDKSGKSTLHHGRRNTEKNRTNRVDGANETEFS